MQCSLSECLILGGFFTVVLSAPPLNETPQGEVLKGELPKDNELQGKAGQGVRPQGEITQGEIVQTEKPQVNLTQGEIVQTEKPQVNLTQGEIPEGGRAISSGNGQIITYPTHDTDVHQRTAVVELSPSSLEHPVTGTLRLTEVKFEVQVELILSGLPICVPYLNMKP